MSDRRSGEERRDTARHPVEIEVEWESSVGRQPGTMSDVSLEGCFVLSSGELTDGEPVKIFVPLADGMRVQFDGTVANFVYDIGFGVKFERVSPAQRDLLARMMQQTKS